VGKVAALLLYKMRHPPAVMPLWKYIQVMRMQIFLEATNWGLFVLQFLI
jgi:hypothetical protein